MVSVVQLHPLSGAAALEPLGAGLPAGDVTRFALDACVRFDGPLFVAEVDGACLKRLLTHCNQGADTPFAERAGENRLAVAPTDSRCTPFLAADRGPVGLAIAATTMSKSL